MCKYVVSKIDLSLRVRVCASNMEAVSLEIPVRDGFIYKVIPRSVFEDLYVEERACVMGEEDEEDL